MKQQPTITTERLILRPYRPEDAADIQRLIGERDVVATLANVPYPYEDGMYQEWLGGRQESFETGKTVDFAVTHRQEGFLIGGTSLMNIDQPSERAEIAYWIGKPYWGKGYGTEAARAVVKYGFETLGLHRINGRHFGNNPASGRILKKIGMKHEGCQRQAFKKWGKFEDFELYGILRSEYEKGLSP
ncbi:MAG: GNAT family N-acetyltransferase [Dehalococcoidia bacterium]|jgi:RimJ/RimL family protein N-acetyltransferase